MKFLKSAIRIWTTRSLPITLATILLLFLLLLSYGYSSIHILSIGDWPHDVLKPLYGATSLQMGWAPSLGLVPQSHLGKFEVIVVDTSVKDYLAEEPWKSRFLDYVSSGGSLVKIIAKSSPSGGEIVGETRWGKGRIVEVVGTPNPAYQASNWKSAQVLWTGIFQSSIPAYRWMLLRGMKLLTVIATIFLAFCLLFRGERAFPRQGEAYEEQRERSGQVAPHNKGKLSGVARMMKSNSRYIFVGLGLLFLTLVLISPLLMGWRRGEIPWFDEAAHSLGAIQYYVDYIRQYHSLPLTWDSFTYSQPMDYSYYLRTPVAIVPVVLSLTLNIGAAGSLVLSYFILLLSGMGAAYYCIYKHTRSVVPSLLAVVLYAFSPFTIFALRTGEPKLFFAISLIPLLWLCLDHYFGTSHRGRAAIALVLAVAVYAWFTTINTIIALIALASLLLLIIEIYGFREKLPRLVVAAVACGSVTIAYLFFTQAFASFYETPVMTPDDYEWQTSPNLLQALALRVGQSNGMPAEMSSVGLNRTYTIITFLPLALSTVSVAYTRKYFLAYSAGIMLLLLSLGFYGPLSWLYLHFPMPFRATGRTLMPVASLIFSFLAASGVSSLFQQYNIASKARRGMSLAIIALLPVALVFGVGLSTALRYVNTYRVPPEIEQAYQSIPPGAQVLVLPMHGPLDFGNSISSPGASSYKRNASVGWFIAHLHTYEAGKNQLNDAYAPISRWEVPFLTGWYFGMVQEKIADWNDTFGALKLLDYASNLQYLVVYKNLVPDHTLNYLNQDNQFTKTYENELIAVYHKEQAISAPLMESEKAFLLYSGSYRHSLPSVSQLARSSIPVILGQTPWYSLDLEEAEKMSNLTIVTQDLDLDRIAKEYAILDVRDKIIINPEGSLSISEGNWKASSFWQPLLGKYGISSSTWQPSMVSFKVSNTTTYDILIRTANNGPWQGNLLVRLDDRIIGEGFFLDNEYGLKWFEVKTIELAAGKHTLTFFNTEPRPVDIDAVAIVDHSEYEEKLMAYQKKLSEMIGGKDYLGIYEAETSFVELLNGNIVDDWTNDPSQYPSGGWPRGSSVKLSPPYPGTNSLAEFVMNVDIPVSQEYYLTLRQKGANNLMIDGEYLSPLESYSSEGWTNTVYKRFLSPGTHPVRLSNDGESSTWIDVVYISNRPLSEITNNNNPTYTLTVINPSDYRVVSTAAQPRYVLLMKSYVPFWKLLSPGEEEKAYLANGFLTAFYVENQTYSVRFKP